MNAWTGLPLPSRAARTFSSYAPPLAVTATVESGARVASSATTRAPFSVVVAPVGSTTVPRTSTGAKQAEPTLPTSSQYCPAPHPVCAPASQRQGDGDESLPPQAAAKAKATKTRRRTMACSS